MDAVVQPSRLKFVFRSFHEDFPYRTSNNGLHAEYTTLGYGILTADFTVSGPDREVKAFLQQIQDLYQENRLQDFSCSASFSITEVVTDVRCSVLRQPGDKTPALLTLTQAALPAPKET